MSNYFSNFPYTRLRRLRKKNWSRKLIQENLLSVNDLILPIFITYANKSSNIKSMPNIKKFCIDDLLGIVTIAYNLGIKAVALFPEVPDEKKDVFGKEAYNNDNIICQAVRKIKSNFKDIGVICDIALDPYTVTGHDGILIEDYVNNDETIEVLKKQALVNVEAGCDVLAPSDMMDGRIGSLREVMENNNYKEIIIMSYAAKYSSNYYYPFRKAISASNNLGKDKKKSYQMDYSNIEEAFREVYLDIKEGADIILVKPGLPYLDVLSAIKSHFKYPTFSYQVSGEYSILKNAIVSEELNEAEIILETLSCFKRAGADAILTYFALDAAKILNDHK